MTKEQFEHYIKGGKFKAIYNPTKTSDLVSSCKSFVGKEITVYQNMVIAPIQDDTYNGQHQFNAEQFRAWFPEEDIEILDLLPDVIANVEPLPIHMYRLYYNTQEAIDSNFGKNTGLTPPFRAARNFSNDQDTYVLGLSNPQAERIEKCIWQGLYQEKMVWRDIYTKEKGRIVQSEEVFEEPAPVKYRIEEQDSLE